jgi:glycerol kinase
MAELLLAIDQGTTGTTCLVVDPELAIVGRGYAELPQHFPRPGWVEHDPEEIWSTVEQAASAALVEARVDAGELAGIGITNQRETTVLWDRRTGRPAHNAIVWQDRRTADRCAELPRGLIRARTGLVPDPYFSATKLEWLLREAGTAEGLAFGTVDSWLVWKLAGEHLTDATNASRTMLASLATRSWDDELLELFGVPRSVLPEIRGSSEVVGEGRLLGSIVPVAGIAGDQQASLHGHGCVEAGQAKATYGTGSFVLTHTGSDVSPPPHGLLRTAAVEGTALEGAVFVAGAAVQWLRDGLGLLAGAAESEDLAASVEDTGGVYFVPALTGLGSPHWAPGARGLVCGLSRSTRREHLVRATLEAIAYQVRDVLETLPVDVLRADGGATQNAFLMQFQADLLGTIVEVAREPETTALGAAALAAQALGLRDGPPRPSPGAIYEPRMSRDEAETLYAGWRDALRRTLSR